MGHSVQTGRQVIQLLNAIPVSAFGAIPVANTMGSVFCDIDIETEVCIQELC